MEVAALGSLMVSVDVKQHRNEKAEEDSSEERKTWQVCS